MKCPDCDQENPQVTVIHDEQIMIAGTDLVSNLAQKAAVQVECQHCQAHFTLEFKATPTGLMLDLS